MGCCSSKQAERDLAEQQNSKVYIPEKDALIVEDRKYLIHILCATDVPKLDVTSKSDPYVKLKILDGDGQPKGSNIKTLYRMDNANPIWNCYRSFTANATSGPFTWSTVFFY